MTNIQYSICIVPGGGQKATGRMKSDSIHPIWCVTFNLTQRFFTESKDKRIKKRLCVKPTVHMVARAHSSNVHNLTVPSWAEEAMLRA